MALWADMERPKRRIHKTPNTHSEKGPLPEGPEREENNTSMATSNWTVYVPDRTASLPFPKTMEIEEIRASLVSTGTASVASATYTVDGDVIRFNRVQGGSKGL